MYSIIEDSLAHLGIAEGFDCWEFLEENSYQGIKGTLIQNYYTQKSIYKMVGLSILNGIDMRNNNIYNNVVTSRVIEEGIIGTHNTFSIQYEEFIEGEVVSSDLTNKFIESGFNKVYIFHPTRRFTRDLSKEDTSNESEKEEWGATNKDELYEESYLAKETKDKVFLISLEKINMHQYSIYFGFQESIADAIAYKKRPL